MLFYNKLVRDRIPEIIRTSGKECTVRQLDPAERLPRLTEKLQEELDEYRQTGDIHELADMLEVIYAIVADGDLSYEEFEYMRQAKREERGGFDDGLLLVSVSEIK